MNKAFLIGTVLGASVLGASPALAQDAGASANAAEMDALRAQLQDLQNRLKKLESAPKPEAAPKSAAWAADTSISGRMYYNMSSITADDAAGANVRKDGGFEIKRFYLGVDHKFSDIFSANLTTDITAATGSGAQLYVKKAYLQAKLNPALVVRVGATDMPWIPYAEGIYGYRHIEKTLTDLDGFGTSSDWGVHVMGDFAKGLVSYQISAVNGAGYKTVTATKSIDLEGRLSLNYHGVNVAVGGYTGKLGKDVAGATVFHTANRFNALVAYKGKINDVAFTLGGEYFYAKNWKTVTSALEDSSDGYSLFASVSPVKKWSVFGRYDWVKPSKDLAPTMKDHYYNVGIQYSPAKIVDFALVYKRDKGDNGVAIGNLAAGQATRDEIGLYGQFRF